MCFPNITKLEDFGEKGYAFEGVRLISNTAFEWAFVLTFRVKNSRIVKFKPSIICQ